MSNFRNMMSELRLSKEKTVKTNTKKEKQKYIFPSIGKTYIVRFLPYMNKTDNPLTIKEIWYHYVDKKKYICEGKVNGCPICAKGNKATQQRLLNLQIIKTDDKNYREGDYHILPIHWSLYNILDKYEKDNSLSLFDVFGAGEVTIKVTKGTGTNAGGKEYMFAKFDESSISEIRTAISSEINNYDDEQIISYLKEFTYDLDEEAANIPRYKAIQESVVDLTTESKEEVKIETKEVSQEDVSESIENAISNIDIDNDNEDLVEEVKVEEKPKTKTTKKTTPKTTTKKVDKKTKEEPVEEAKDEDSSADTDDYINDFLNSIED